MRQFWKRLFGRGGQGAWLKHHAATALLDRDWARAARTLEAADVSLDTTTWLSYLYRLQDEYGKEIRIIKKTIAALGSHDPYLQGRKKWHDAPVFQRLEQRPPLHLARQLAPPDALLEQLVFISGADSNYFDFVVSLIESLKATRHYNGIPICIGDFGLSVAQKTHLLEDLRIARLLALDDLLAHPAYIETNRWTKLTNPTPMMMAAIVRMNMPELFPGFRYYFWLDADNWVQDETYLDEILCHVDIEGCGVVCRNLGYTVLDDFKGAARITYDPPGLIDEARSCPTVTGNTFCVDARTDIFERYRAVAREIYPLLAKYKIGPWMDQHGLSLTVRRLNERVLVTKRHNRQFRAMDCGVIVDPEASVVGGVIAHAKGTYQDAMPVSNTPFGADLTSTLGQEFEAFAQLFRNDPCSYPVTNSFRTWPWRDKKEIETVLLREAEGYLQAANP